MNRKVIGLLLISLCLFIQCKPKEPEIRDFKPASSIGFTVIDNIPVYKDYKQGSIINYHLPLNSEIKITGFFKTEHQRNVLDWIEIQTNDTTNYIPGSYLTKQGLSVFNPLEEEKIGMITASSLRVREQPSLTANIITYVPRGSTIKILMEGITLQTIDNRTDKWVRVKTSEGKIGFSFKGFIQDIFERESTEAYNGYIELTTSEMKYWRIPGWVLIKEKIEDLPEDICRMSLKHYPKQGAILQVSEKAVVDSKTYYRMDHHKLECISACPCGTLDYEETWFSDDQVKYISNADISNYTLEKYEKPEYIELLKEYAKVRNNSVNFFLVKVTEHKIKTSSDIEIQFFEVRDEYEKSVRVFSRKENQFKLLIDGNICGSYWYIDINSDGILEIIESSSNWDGSGFSHGHTIFFLRRGKYEEIFNYQTVEGLSYTIEHKFENSNLILSTYMKRFDEKENEEREDLELTQIYYFKNGQFILAKEIKKKD